MIYNVNGEYLKLQLEPVFDLISGEEIAFEVKLVVRNEDINARLFLGMLDKHGLSFVCTRKLEFFQKLNEQNKDLYNSMFMEIDQGLINDWVCRGELLPFAFQFKINMVINYNQMVRNEHGIILDKTMLSSFLNLRAMGVSLWLGEIDGGKFSLPSELLDVLNGIRLDKSLVLEF